jgi:ribosomal protein S18 acetylase RimI-like enzyme
MNVTTKEVITTSDLKKFVKFPAKLYKGNSYWVPPLIFDEMQTLRKDKNPSFEYCEARYWLAYKSDKIVGRVAAIINHRANEKWGYKHVRFGWIDFIDDTEVSKALLDEVEKWGAEAGMDAIDGPLGFTDMDNEGMLVDGFDKLPTISNIYNYPYYPVHLEKHGYARQEDWLQFKFNASQPVPEKMERMNKLVMQKYNLHIKRFTKAKQILPYGRKFFYTLNKAFSNLYGFVDLTDKEIDKYVKQYLSFLQPKLVCLVFDKNDEIVAFGISMPSLSRAYQKAKGRLFPFGFIHILRALSNYDNVDLYLNGVHPDWQKKGVVSIYYAEMNKSFIENKVKIAISNQQLESNVNAIAMWQSYESEPYIRRRCYKKELESKDL